MSPRTFSLICFVCLTLPLRMWAHGGFDELIEELTVKIAASPGDASLLFQMADAQSAHGDAEAALATLRRVEQLAPGKYPTDLVRGAALLTAAQPSAAKKALDLFLAAHPQNVRALTLRARAAQDLGQRVAGLADFQAALQSSAIPEPDLVRETADALVADGQTEEAVRVLGAGIEKLGAVPALVLRAMDLEMATGHFDAALSRVEAMQASAPRPEPWMAKRASVLAHAGRADEARAAWQALLTHLTALPNLERGSHAMCQLAEEAQQALKTPLSLSQTPPAAPHPSRP